MYRQLKETWEEMTGPGQPFEVTKVNVRGLELNAFASAPNSLRDIWLMSAGHGDKDYLVYEDERWTYARAHAEVGAIAAWLVGQGVAPGDRVAIAMRNYPEWMLAYWATVSIGAALARADEPLDDLIKRADEKLYDAKHKGRNQVQY